MCTMSSPKDVENNHMAAPVKVARQQQTTPDRNSLEPSEPCLRNLHQHAPELSATLRNLPDPTSGTYTSTPAPPKPSKTLRNVRNLPEPTRTFRWNLHQHTPEPSEIFRNVPPEPTPAHTGTLRNLLSEPTPALTRTLRNLPPEPAPATRTGTHRSLSGLKTPLAHDVGEINK